MANYLQVQKTDNGTLLLHNRQVERARLRLADRPAEGEDQLRAAGGVAVFSGNDLFGGLSLIFHPQQ